VLLNLLFKVGLQFPEEFKVRLGVETLDGVEVFGEQTIQILGVRAVQKQADVHELSRREIGNIAHQVV